MTNITKSNWQNPKSIEKKQMTCISITPSLLEKFRKKYPQGSFSAFIEQQLKEEINQQDSHVRK